MVDIHQFELVFACRCCSRFVILAQEVIDSFSENIAVRSSPPFRVRLVKLGPN